MNRSLIAFLLAVLSCTIAYSESIGTSDLSAWRQSKSPLSKQWQLAKNVHLNPDDSSQLVAEAGTGVLYSSGRADYLLSKADYGDVQLHVEFYIPKGSNSGVYMMGRYEIQIYDSFGVAKAAYPGIECGGIYPRHDGQRGAYEGHSPAKNVSRVTGQWQSFDITFRAPRFNDSGEKIANACFVKVVHNGELIHENVEVTGMTRSGMSKQETATGPIRLQGDHGPVAYRNLKVTPLTTDQDAAIQKSVSTRLESVVPADSSLVLLEGRSVRSEDGSVKIAYPGTKIKVAFVGPQLLMKYQATSDSVYVDVIVDSTDTQRIQLRSGKHEQVLFSGSPGEHTVEIHKRTEGWQGILKAISFEASTGHFVAPMPLPKRKLLFIGDSITAGASIDILPDDPATGDHHSNGRLAYGRVLADRLGAQCHLIAYGGRGLIRDWQGMTETNNAPQFYEWALSDDANSSWDATQYVPDAISICLGTNDFNQGVPDEATYVKAYVDFIRQLRRDAPDAHLFLLNSPMFGDNENRKKLNQYIEKTIATLGESNITKIDVRYYPGRPGVDAHPVAPEHVKIADELEPVFRRELKW
ncbi:family 16 glycoside hydrolase [Novipirellula herctigrandis]